MTTPGVRHVGEPGSVVDSGPVACDQEGGGAPASREAVKEGESAEEAGQSA